MYLERERERGVKRSRQLVSLYSTHHGPMNGLATRIKFYKPTKELTSEHRFPSRNLRSGAECCRSLSSYSTRRHKIRHTDTHICIVYALQLGAKTPCTNDSRAPIDPFMSLNSVTIPTVHVHDIHRGTRADSIAQSRTGTCAYMYVWNSMPRSHFRSTIL